MITFHRIPLVAKGLSAVCILATAACSDGHIGGSDANNTGIIQSTPCDGRMLKGTCIPNGTFTLQGVVFDTYNGPRANTTIDVRVLLPDGSGYLLWDVLEHPVVTDSIGRFTLTALPESKVLLWASAAGYLQPCVNTVDLHGDESHDVEVVSADTLNSLDPPRPLTLQEPTLTGTVFEMTAAGKQPVAGVAIELEESYLTRATTVTDLNGHYFLCNVPGKDIELGVYKSGYVARYIEPVDTSQATFDIELTPVRAN